MSCFRRLRAVLCALTVAATAVSVPAVPAHADTAPATCGTRTLYKPDGTAWVCAFDDEFGGTALDRTKWDVESTASNGYHSGEECFVDDPSTVSVGGGHLKLTVRRTALFSCASPRGAYPTSYTSGMVYSGSKFTQAYGRFAVRVKISRVAVPGLQTSLWLWPADQKRYGPVWPDSGEIDIAELFSRFADRAIPYVHYVETGDPNVTNNYCMISDLGTYHVYELVWTPKSLTFRFNGHTCLVDRWQPADGLTAPAPFDAPFMVIITQALGIVGNAFDPATTPLPASTTVDWVRVWK